jgi:hypothetical protein
MLRYNSCVLIQLVTSKFGMSLHQYWDSDMKQKLAQLAKEDSELVVKEVTKFFH